jgi:eukaryotic-like serine/threonine-protein kinase
VSSFAPIARDALPPRLGRYEVRAKIGDGGMATVYLGRPSSAHGALYERLVALKVIKQEFCQNPEFVTMFHDEAKIISSLSHPNLVQVVELGSEGNRLFIAMELLMGQSLWEVWNACRARGVRLRYDLIAWMGARVADGLHHAHEMRDAQGQLLMLVHRDVNQSNIFLTYDGQVKVIDFGLATAKGRAYKTAGGVVKGKIAYLAPEQVAGHPVDRRADIFALGTTLWELTTDRRLFRGKDDAETLRRIYSAEVPDPTTLVHGYPPTLWEILRRALGRDANSRYASAADFGRSLDYFARSEGRAVDGRSLGDVMRELFSMEHVRDKQWLAEASQPDRPAPVNTMHPPSVATIAPPADANAVNIPPPPIVPGDAAPVSSWPRGVPPDGMFSPAPSRPGHLMKEQTGGATPFAMPEKDGSSQVAGLPRKGGMRRALWLLLLVVLVVVGFVVGRHAFHR